MIALVLSLTFLWLLHAVGLLKNIAWFVLLFVCLINEWFVLSLVVVLYGVHWIAKNKEAIA